MKKFLMNGYYLQRENEGIPYSLNDEHFDFGSKLKIVLSVLQHSIQLRIVLCSTYEYKDMLYSLYEQSSS